MNSTILGLDREKVSGLKESLNELLANFQVYYQNLRGLHWNIKGKSFFELHVKFEELYTDSQEKIDMIAERILTLEGTPLHTFKDYMDLSAVPVVKELSHLPIVVDPSHAIGIRNKVMPLARASVAVGADGIMVEVHPDPNNALSDGAQSLYPDQFDRLMSEIKNIAETIGRKI